MTIIVLIILGFVILAFAIIFRPRHTNSLDRIMEQNHNVMPLFKERSALIKYNALHHTLKKHPQALKTLEKLHADFKDHVIDVDAYHDALEQMDQQYNKH
jgi:hypothetical protein